jgi:hypothetical protein
MASDTAAAEKADRCLIGTAIDTVCPDLRAIARVLAQACAGTSDAGGYA